MVPSNIDCIINKNICTKHDSDIEFIINYGIHNKIPISLDENDINYLENNKPWVNIMSQYLWTRGYAKKFYTIIFDAIKLRILSELDINYVLSGDLDMIYGDIKSKFI